MAALIGFVAGCCVHLSVTLRDARIEIQTECPRCSEWVRRTWEYRLARWLGFEERT